MKNFKLFFGDSMDIMGHLGEKISLWQIISQMVILNSLTIIGIKILLFVRAILNSNIRVQLS